MSVRNGATRAGQARTNRTTISVMLSRRDCTVFLQSAAPLENQTKGVLIRNVEKVSAEIDA